MENELKNVSMKEITHQIASGKLPVSLIAKINHISEETVLEIIDELHGE